MGLFSGKPPQMVMDLTDEQVARWREGDDSVWDERRPGQVDRFVRPGTQRGREPEWEAEAGQ